MKRVEVTWRDAHFMYEGLVPVEFDFMVKTVGYVVEDGPVWLVVAQEALPDGEWRAITLIPQVLVQPPVLELNGMPRRMKEATTQMGNARDGQ